MSSSESTTVMDTTNASTGGDDDITPAYVYAAISCGVVVLLLIITVLVIVILHRIHRKLATRNNKLFQMANVEKDIGSNKQQDHPRPPSPSYDDILSFSEVIRRKSVDEDDRISTSCNEAYGVRPGKAPNAGCRSKMVTTIDDAHKQQVLAKIAPTNTVYATIEDDNDSLKTNDAYDGPVGVEVWTVGENRLAIENREDTPDDAEDREGTPDYENVVPADHLFGNYVQPEFLNPSTSAEVHMNLRNVHYSDLKGLPRSRGMTLSRSLPDILEQIRKEESKGKGNKRHSLTKKDQVRITLPSSRSSNFTLL